MSRRCASDLILQHYHRKYLRVNSETDQRSTGYDFEAGKFAKFVYHWGFAADLEALELASDIQSDASLGHKLPLGFC
ncbi:hypothetical protein ACJ73_04900 [Blastomyces percursus]|uniref:Uncharacterized protein n=1 Tax=Blastomyces percursus TaxID=1658174 RepID=A0A1J9Q6Q7_9EURO|nr:hypothetical protein ACJ73_04900 [Blastomyces percursus]